MTSAATTEILVLANARAAPGKESALEAALLEVAAPTRAQPGCLRFELFRSAQDASAVTAIERWASSDHHQRHLQGDHVKRLMTKFEGILAAPPEIVVMKPL